LVEGGIYYIEHARYPEMKLEYVSKDFTCFFVSTTLVFKYHKETEFFKKEDILSQAEKEEYYRKVLAEIEKIDPSTVNSEYWYGFLQGY